MAPYDVHHHDPHPLARSAAIRTNRELDPTTREEWRRMSMNDRLIRGIELSRAASRLKGIASVGRS